MDEYCRNSYNCSELGRHTVPHLVVIWRPQHDFRKNLASSDELLPVSSNLRGTGVISGYSHSVWDKVSL